MFMMDLVMQPEYACTLMDRFVSLKIAYYESAARRFGRYVNFIREVDDIAGQQNMLISPQMYRDLLKPRHKALFDAQTRLFGTDDFFIWFHSDGAVREILPDMLEIGMNVLNPVQTSAFGMDAAGLKRDFGQNCAFWGGGADTQHVLPHSSPENVRDHVKNAVSALSRGGGYVFGTVHNIQDDVPTENILAMLEAFNEVRNYN
jgi:uroporphyrinogen decarboxylase